jgi:lysophospholipase L1-like esterase
MNINQSAIRILCYGDSNTWGDTPDGNFSRYPANIRWTGLLQEKLGDGFEIIEEGLCGRTTVLDDKKEEGRNGKTYLIPCIKTHNPLDLVVLMLGTNDLKERFNQSAEQISKNIEELVILIKKLGINKNNKSSKILLISPGFMKENCKKPETGMIGAEEKSKQFAKFYQEVAKRQDCEFVDIAQYIQPSLIDGCHFEKEAHAKIAEVLAEKIETIFR